MRFEPTTVKGFQDFLPPISLKRRAVKKIVEKWFKLYGFLPVETPIIEFDELMRPDSLEAEDQTVSDRFRLRDRGGRNLGLRYEFTFQLSRIFKENPNIKLPFKRYQVGPVFRDEPTGTNRFRQFTQCDADIIGDSEISSDAECLTLISDILKELKIEAEIEINNRSLLSSIIESVQIKNKGAVMRELDKLDKLGEDVVKANLKKYAGTNQILTLFKLLEKPLNFFKENDFEGVEAIQELIEKCKAYGVKVKFNPFMIRGLGYYTGNIFEVREKGKTSIAAGGRYDKTVGRFLTRQIPAVGISFGLERITSLSQIQTSETQKVLLISIDQEKETIKLARKLRKENISCSITEKVGKALEYANSLQIPYVIFIGKEEASKDKFKLRDMISGTEKLLNEKQLVKALSK